MSITSGYTRFHGGYYKDEDNSGPYSIGTDGIMRWTEPVASYCVAAVELKGVTP